jgi:Disaggregatase related
MLKMKSKIFFLISCFILASTPAALCITSAPIIYVAGDGSGDFNCDGRDDHVQINQALQFVSENSGYTTVYLKGPFTYFIDDTLLIGSNTIIEGDSSATIKLTSGAGWEAWKPMIKERSPGSHDITIRGFTIDGNRGDQTEGSGHGYYNLIHLTGCQNINVYNMYLTNNDGDGLKTDKCSNLKFYDNIVSLLGHDGLYASTCSDVEAYNNTITCRTNSALRMYNTNRVSLHDNILTSEGSGGAGIKIQKYNSPAMDDIDVYNNTIYKTALAGIWMFGSGSYSISSANIHIHHNQIYDTGTRSSTSVRGGIVSDGFSGLIETT